MPVRATPPPEALDIANGLRHIADELERSNGVREFSFQVSTMMEHLHLWREVDIRFTFDPDLMTVENPTPVTIVGELTNGDVHPE